MNLYFRTPILQKLLIIYLGLFLTGTCLFGQGRPKIGVTLSGGGAKGLAHIGILQAIDSAGLHVDYVTGTSMGSIIGGLYAVGYSADSINKIAHDLNWEVILSNKPVLQNVSIDEKEEFGMYALEVPLEKWKPKISTGIIEGEELWLTLAKYFMPMHTETDFSKFKKGFRCIATDVENGDAIVLKEGDIVNSVRASMAIPSVFTAVEIDGRTLVDGGLIRNFPVSDAINMGADLIIGVNVGQPLSKAEELNSPLAVLYQISFYRDAKDFEKEKKLCDIFIEPDILDYNAASFDMTDSIMERGYRKGLEFYPVFKALADSLNKLYPEPEEKELSYTLTDSVKVGNISWVGVSPSTQGSFNSRLDLIPNTTYLIDDINSSIRNVFGTRNYDNIQYDLTPTDGSSNLKLNVNEKSGVYLKAALHYNTYSNAAIITSLTLKNKLLDRSRLLAKAALGQNPRIKLEYRKYFAKKDQFSITLNGYFDAYELPLYFTPDLPSNYRFMPLGAYISIDRFFRTSYLSAGTGIIRNRIKPKVFDIVSIEGTSHVNEFHLRYYLNTTDKHFFATRGWEVEAQALHYFDQRPDYVITLFGEPLLNSDDIIFAFTNYQSLHVKSYHFVPISRSSTLLTAHHLGINLNYSQSFLNQFSIGGITDFVFNQVPFAGLPHARYLTNSFGTLMVGWQYQLLTSVYTTLRANAALYDFDNINTVSSLNAKNNFISGYSATIGVSSPIGPVEFSLQYSDQISKFSGYVNLGFHF